MTMLFWLWFSIDEHLHDENFIEFEVDTLDGSPAQAPTPAPDDRFRRNCSSANVSKLSAVAFSKSSLNFLSKSVVVSLVFWFFITRSIVYS